MEGLEDLILRRLLFKRLFHFVFAICLLWLGLVVFLSLGFDGCWVLNCLVLFGSTPLYVHFWRHVSPDD
jgi:hypothetical protein